MGFLLCRYTHVRCLMHQPLCCSATNAEGVGRERLQWWLHPQGDSQNITFASVAAWLSPQEFPTTMSSSCPLSLSLSAVNSSSCPGIAPQFLCSSSQPLHLLGTFIPVWGMYGYGKDCLTLIPLRLLQSSCFTLSLKCFSSDPASYSSVGIGPLLQFTPAKSRSSPTNTPLVPSSCRVLHGYIFFPSG